MSEVIVITSGKGGVGKTTASANIGTGLAQLGNKVVLIDTDIGLRNLDVVLGLENRIVYNLVDVVEGNCRIKQALIKDKNYPNLALLPSAQTRDKSAVTPEQMKKLTDELREEFDYVLLDSPAGIGQGFENAVVAADNALVVVTPDPVSVRDGAKVAALLRQQQIKRARLVINKIQSALILNGVLLNLDEIIDAVGLQLIAAIPNDDAVICAGAQGEPLPDCNAAKAFLNLAKRMENQIVPLLNLKKIC